MTSLRLLQPLHPLLSTLIHTLNILQHQHPQRIQRAQHKRQHRKRHQGHTRTLGLAARTPVIRIISLSKKVDQLARHKLARACQRRVGKPALGPLARRVCELLVLDGGCDDRDEGRDEGGDGCG
jgi:hypothetical protein